MEEPVGWAKNRLKRRAAHVWDIIELCDSNVEGSIQTLGMRLALAVTLENNVIPKR